ncbi:hypothetical protein E2C01_026230 [Portunus trituberculatus]|uniref:Uncharacterized protein n=1 Tax=Portunus trituberculatus TaxID=210409 RepID=A0A5B7EI88_PORTR|nr:hypothetical protein [Portunus trituberculatus]
MVFGDAWRELRDTKTGRGIQGSRFRRLGDDFALCCQTHGIRMEEEEEEKEEEKKKEEEEEVEEEEKEEEEEEEKEDEDEEEREKRHTATRERAS